MSFLKRIELNNYRNFQYFENEFSSNCNVFFGNNGTGKTNILESISLFDKGSGIRNDKLKNIIKFTKNNFLNQATFCIADEDYNAKVLSEKINDKLVKKIFINEDNKKDSLNHFRSLLSFIVFQPEMERLFLLSPSYRRKFIDRFIYSDNKNYNKLLNQYKKNLIERTNLIISYNNDESWITNIEENIAKLGMEIYSYRNQQIHILNDNLIKLFKDKKSPFLIKLENLDSSINENPNIITDIDVYKKKLKENRKIDSFKGGATFGPHRSDFNGVTEKNILLDQLSTGEQKTVVLLLIFAQCNFLVKERNIYPIILMDEICSHLDEVNRSILLNLSKEFNLQFFMTGTDKSLFSFLSTNAQYCNISK